MLWKGVSIGWNGFLSPLERWNHPSLVRGGQTTHQELDRVGTLARDRHSSRHVCTELRFQIIQAVKTQFHECTIQEFWSCSNLSLQQKEFIQSIYCTLYMLVYSQIQYTFQYLTFHIFHSRQKYFERKSKQQQMQLHAIDVKLRKKCVFWDFVDP